jgi:hypothetical protein
MGAILGGLVSHQQVSQTIKLEIHEPVLLISTRLL